MNYEIDQEKLSELLVMEHSAFIVLNGDEDHFSRTFGKLEINNSLKVINRLRAARRIPAIAVNFNYSNSPDSEAYDGLSGKRKSRTGRTSSISGQYSDLRRDFLNNMSSLSPLMTVTSRNENAFNSVELSATLESLHIDRVFITGFDTDAEVIVTASGTLSRGIMPVVVSDGVSSPSERLHFSALEILSNFSEIVDSREMSIFFFGE